MKSKILFDNNGDEFVAVYSDELKSIVPKSWDLKISRISDVEYDHSRKVWVATRKDGAYLAEDKNRSKCVQKEVHMLNNNLKDITTVT